MAQVLRLNGLLTYSSPHTYGVVLKTNERIKVRDAGGAILLATGHFTDIGGVTFEHDVSEVYSREVDGFMAGTVVTTVAGLPAASVALRGQRGCVTNASVAYVSANVGSVVAGGGANVVPVFCNGVAWVIG